VIGAGTMGGGIAMNFLNAGIPVTILEMKQEALDRGIATIRKNYEGQVKKGKLKQDKYEQRMGLLKTTLSYDDIGQADLVIEAVFEEMGVKQKVFEKLDEVMKKGAILASNTSTLDVDQIAAFTKRPAGRGRPALLQPGQRDEAAGSGARRKTGKDVMATVMAWPRRSRRRRWSPASATASSATA
jgi:3-hydroxyacyl-CoA dehydrogenase